MNVYDKLNELTTAIKESDEFKNYESLAKTVDSNPEWSALMEDFLRAQIAFSQMQMFGQEPTDEEIGQFNEIYSRMLQVETITKFVQAQNLFSRMMTDINDAIMKAGDIEANFLNVFNEMEHECGCGCGDDCDCDCDCDCDDDCDCGCEDHHHHHHDGCGCGCED